MLCYLQIVCLILVVFVVQIPTYTATSVTLDYCTKLQIGQYECERPPIDPQTQEIRSCNKSEKAPIKCTPTLGIQCKDEYNNDLIVDVVTTFTKYVDCRYTNGYNHNTALLLSIFLGWLGVDRFYLGYPAIGLLKLSTFGLCGFGALADFMLIALQVVLPADGSNYVIDYYGPRLTVTPVRLNEDTYYHYK